MGTVTSVLAFILLIGPLIFIHELGHLVAAKLVDVKVKRFSIGFGPPILRAQLGETEYCIAPIPLGGYVSLLGQNPHESISTAEHERSLAGKPLWARYLVLGAGPLANLVLPLFLYFAFFLSHTVYSPPVLGTILDDSAAQAADLVPGDRIVGIDGTPVRSWNGMRERISRSPNKELRLQVERDNQRFDRFVIPRQSVRRDPLGDEQRIGLLGAFPWFYSPQIGIIDPGSPAYRKGLRTGDIITSINGEPLRTVEEFEHVLGSTKEAQLRLTYLRAQATPTQLATFLFYESHHATILPRGDETGGNVGLLAANTFIRLVEPGSPAARAGLQPGDQILSAEGKPITRWETLALVLDRRRTDPVSVTVRSLGEEPREVTITQQLRSHRDDYRHDTEYVWFGAQPYANRYAPDPEPIRGRFTYAARAAWRHTVEMMTLTWTALRQMVTLQRGVDEISSVVGIFNFAGTAAEKGPGEFLQLMAGLSLNLGFVNLLPIPVLDGGHLLFFTAEAIRRRPLEQRAREIASAIGLFIILMLLLIALRNDLARYWTD
ncbi:MAG: RIP metalloprotease RseP [Myxococcales bacterium FL481]|nr:MAG: RIP metalloprotease RseP [Myxococcales bacterium FL481]